MARLVVQVAVERLQGRAEHQQRPAGTQDFGRQPKLARVVLDVLQHVQVEHRVEVALPVVRRSRRASPADGHPVAERGVRGQCADHVARPVRGRPAGTRDTVPSIRVMVPPPAPTSSVLPPRCPANSSSTQSKKWCAVPSRSRSSAAPKRSSWNVRPAGDRRRCRVRSTLPRSAQVRREVSNVPQLQPAGGPRGAAVDDRCLADAEAPGHRHRHESVCTLWLLTGLRVDREVADHTNAAHPETSRGVRDAAGAGDEPERRRWRACPEPSATAAGPGVPLPRTQREPMTTSRSPVQQVVDQVRDLRRVVPPGGVQRRDQVGAARVQHLRNPSTVRVAGPGSRAGHTSTGSAIVSATVGLRLGLAAVPPSSSRTSRCMPRDRRA